MQHPNDVADNELIARTDARHRRICAEQLAQLRDFVHIDLRKLWERDGARDMAGWVSGRYGLSPWEARRWSNAAHSLEGLTRISDALGAGELSLSKVLELARFAAPDREKQLVSWAKRVSPRTIRRRADRERQPDPGDAAAVEEGQFVRWWFFDQSFGIEGVMPAAQGAVVAKVLQRFADKLPDMPPVDDETQIEDDATVDRRRADALYLIASAFNEKDADEDRSTVVIHRRLPGDEDRIGDAWTELDRSVVLDDEVGRRISCDSRLQVVLTDGEGNPLGIGRTARDVPLWLERLVRHRDGYECAFSGCGMTTFLKSHHIVHWEDGGPTDLPNLVTVCHSHHKLVHEFGWRVTLEGSLPVWFRPSGARFEPGPDPPEQLRFREQPIPA